MRKDEPPDADLVPELPDDLNEFARRLATFEAKSIATDRDRLMFEAGQSAARGNQLAAAVASRRTLRYWQSAAMMLTAVSAGLVATVALLPEPAPQVVIVERDSPPMSVRDSQDHSGDAVATDSVMTQTESYVDETSDITSRSENHLGSNTGAANAFHRYLERQYAIAARLDSNLDSVPTTEEASSSSTFAPASSIRTPLTLRSLMRGDKSRNWINRLIEEPNL